MTNKSKKPENTLEVLLEVLNNYHEKEFDQKQVFKNIDDIPTIIPLAYTTSEDDKHEVQSNFNLEKLQWEEYIDGELMLVSKRVSLEEFIDEMMWSDYDSIISDILYLANNLDGGDNE